MDYNEMGYSLSLHHDSEVETEIPLYERNIFYSVRKRTNFVHFPKFTKITNRLCAFAHKPCSGIFLVYCQFVFAFFKVNTFSKRGSTHFQKGGPHMKKCRIELFRCSIKSSTSEKKSPSSTGGSFLLPPTNHIGRRIFEKVILIRNIRWAASSCPVLRRIRGPI